MAEHYTIERLLALRKLTRSIGEHIRGLLEEYLQTLGPLLRPTSVLGEYVQGGTKVTVKGADKAFRELQTLYETIAGSKPFNLPKELRPPIEILSSTPEITPMEYSYVAKSENESKTVNVTTPLRWVLSYSGFTPGRLRDFLSSKGTSPSEAAPLLLHLLIIHIVVSKQAGMANMLERLHFPLHAEKLPGLGEVPVTCISTSVTTVLPPDGIIIESTEISGRSAFEEVVNLEDIPRIQDPLKERLLELARSHGENLLPS